MNPRPLFCPNEDCPSRGQQAAGNIVVHDSLKDRYVCKDCGERFVARSGTLFYRLRTDPKTVVLVITLLAFGCPIQAVVRAFGLDERTVRRWQCKAGQHCERIHQSLIVEQPRDLQQVQADEIRVKRQRGLPVWMAMAIPVPTRLWLGGVVGDKRDKTLIRKLAAKVKACAQYAPILLVTDGLSLYVRAWCQAFRTPLRTGRVGRPKLIAWPAIYIGQVLKHKVKGRVVDVTQRLVQGTKKQTRRLMPKGHKLNTAYIERLNATFRAHLCPLVRRGRAMARQIQTLHAGMYLVGAVYNLCTCHQSLRQEQPEGPCKWQQSTPAMAAGITDHEWTVQELLQYRLAPTPCVPKKRTGRKPKALQRVGAAATL